MSKKNTFLEAITMATEGHQMYCRRIVDDQVQFIDLKIEHKENGDVTVTFVDRETGLQLKDIPVELFFSKNWFGIIIISHLKHFYSLRSLKKSLLMAKGKLENDLIHAAGLELERDGDCDYDD
jgi:hypothetical protein